MLSLFWDAELCGLVEVYICFEGYSCLHHQGDP